jgi:virginiamycin B lyase
MWLAMGSCPAALVRIMSLDVTSGVTVFPIAFKSAPQAVTSGPDGALWFTDREPDQLGRMTVVGTATRFKLPTSGRSTMGITAGPDGAVWFTWAYLNSDEAQTSDAIGRITSDGKVTEFPLPSTTLPEGITVGLDDALWFTEAASNQIGRIMTGGVLSAFTIPTPQSGPQSIAVGSDGALWFTESYICQIGRITAGGIITEFKMPAGCKPQFISGGPDHALWFTATYGPELGRLTTSGRFTPLDVPPTISGSQEEPGKPLNPGDIAQGPEGKIWFTEIGDDQLRQVMPPT